MVLGSLDPNNPPFCIPGDVNWWIVLGGVVVQRESAVAKVLELALKVTRSAIKALSGGYKK